MIQSHKFILASNSPRRKYLLNQIGLKFKIHPSKISENVLKNETPKENVLRLSLQKAIDVSKSYKDEIVIGADTIVVLNDKILGKPKSKNDAVKMLNRLSNNSHFVYTGFAFVDSKTKKSFTGFEKTKVTFRKLTTDEIKLYVSSGSPMDKAGAYGIQDDFGAVFIKKINGCYYNVVGLPLQNFFISLNKFINENGK
ncbi:MAG: nucleoside triphosphate pyrophosphatase [Bacteroidota bacterium]